MKCVLYMVIIIGSHYYKLQLLIMKNLKAYILCNIPSTFLFLTPNPSTPPSFILFLLRKQHYTKSIPRSLCYSVFLCKTVQKAIRFPRGEAQTFQFKDYSLINHLSVPTRHV